MRRFTCLLALGSWSLQAASLTPEAVKAWDQYLECQHAKLINRTHKDANFLWLDGSPKLRRQVLDGQVAVAPAAGSGMIKAPSALIHDWVGAAFFPCAKAQDVLAVLRGYDHYKEYYKPAVVSSKVVSKTDSEDRFSIVLVSQNLMVKSVVETEYQSTFGQAGEKQWYGETHSTRIHEVEGGSYVWRLASQTRLEERDGGVYFEVEVMALSREIPGSLRFIVDPVVRRVAKNSLMQSLEQTGEAVEKARDLLLLTNGSQTFSR